MVSLHGIRELPKILLWDLEVGKMRIEIETYQLKQYSSYLPSECITRPRWIVCAAWKWLGEPYVASMSALKDKERFEKQYWDDSAIVKGLCELVTQADILIAHNGDNYDWKIFQGRCVYHGINPPPKPTMIDTLKESRKAFNIESHSLRYLAEYLGVESKGDSPDWDLVSNGDRDEIAACEEYCRQDIKALHAVYERIRPFIRNHPNLNVFSKNHHDNCTHCGHWNVKRHKDRPTKSGMKTQYQCQSCGGYMTVSKTKKTTELRT